MGTRAEVKEDKKRKFVLGDFSGGMRTNIDPSNLQDNEYARMLNGRTRHGAITPIKLPLRITGIPAGNYQGLYGYDTVLTLFINGLAYTRDYAIPNSNFALIAGLALEPTAETVFAELVPASWMNLQRKSASAQDAQTEVKFFSEVFGTPAAMIVQDGVSDPWLLFTTGFARKAKNENEWSNIDIDHEDKREYVPKGKQLTFSSDGRLYIISPDGKEIYRSLTGRALDFVIAIDVDGNKLPNLTSGKPEASRLGYNLTFNPITCIAAIPSLPINSDGEPGFFVGTLKKSWIVYPTYRRMVFAEPTFINQGLFSTGPLNQFSITDILGDVAIITESGITTFNSILTAANEGRNAPFHDEIQALFEGITQVTTCAITSDNYAFFGVDTIYGKGILVYDTLRQKFASFDLYPEVSGYIKQFAEIKVNGIRRLFFITTGNQLFEFNAGNTATCQVYFKEFVTQDTETDLIPRRARFIFDSVVEGGTLSVTAFADGKAGITRSQTISATSPVQTLPQAFPFGTINAPSSYNKTVIFEQPLRGQTIGLLVAFNFQADLLQVELITEDDEQAVDSFEQGVVFNNARTL